MAAIANTVPQLRRATAADVPELAREIDGAEWRGGADAQRHVGARGASTMRFVAAKQDTVRVGDIGDFGRARAARRETALALSMSERLARLHALCKQMSAVKGAASAR